MMKYPDHIIIPAGSRQITIEDVKRWQAMETRLNIVIEQHATSTPQGDLAGKIQDVLMKTLEFVRDGNGNQ